jgi:hypothetical protein
MDAKGAAEWFAKGAKEIYATDRELLPTMALLGETNGIILMPSPKLAERPPQAFAEVTYRLGKVYPWRFVVVIAETWVKSFPADVPTELKQGDLQAAHDAGDPEVHTAIQVYALDVRHPTDSHSITATVKREDPLEWDVMETPGKANGSMPDMLLDAYMQAPALPGPTATPVLAVIVDALMETGVADYAHVLGPEWSQN